MICPECGQEFDYKEAKRMFEHFYSDSSRWKYSVLPEKYCFGCATDIANDMWIDGKLIDPYIDDEE